MQSAVGSSAFDFHTVAVTVAAGRRVVEGTDDRVCGDRFRVWWSAAASLRLSFVTRQPYKYNIGTRDDVTRARCRRRR